MKVYILYNDFEFKIEQVSCDGKKMQKVARDYNEPDNSGPYAVIAMELEDELEPTEAPLCLDCCYNPWNK